jgi:hypothetical protein
LTESEAMKALLWILGIGAALALFKGQTVPAGGVSLSVASLIPSERQIPLIASLRYASLSSSFLPPTARRAEDKGHLALAVQAADKLASEHYIFDPYLRDLLGLNTGGGGGSNSGNVGTSSEGMLPIFFR